MIAPVFGPCLPDYSNPFLKSEPDNPPLAVVRIDSREVPPVSIVEEMSGQEPGLVLELLYSNWGSGVRGSLVYRGGDVTSQTREAFDIEAERRGDPEPRHDANASPVKNQPALCQESGPVQTVVQDCDTSETQPADDEKLGRLAYVKRCLDRGYVLRRKSLLDRCELTPDERQEDKECFAAVDALTPNLSDTERFYIEQLEEQYSRHIRRVQDQRDLHERLARCLREFGYPDIGELLDAEDHETLQRMTKVLDRISA
ncbi:MAG: hypothetical protein FJ284_10305 [Planctomycetes bacterium]|nr:hypothetical protein [Planctomycetota bacterium]